MKRFLLFLFGCIPVRLLFVILAYYINKEYLRYLSFFALIPIIGWLNIILVSPRDTGPEVFGEMIWWKNQRIVHLILYILFAISAFDKESYSWIFLLIDVIFGLVTFLYHHYNVGNFSKLFIIKDIINIEK